MTRQDMNNALQSALVKYAAPAGTPAATSSLAKPAAPSLLTSGAAAPKGLPPAPKPSAGPAIGRPALNFPTAQRAAPGAPNALPAVGLDRFGRSPNGFKPGAPTPATPAPAQNPALASFRQQVDPATFAQMRARQGQMPTPKSHTGMGSYVDVLDRWYNPWTTQQVTEKGEASLMRPAQLAAGTGAAAVGALASIPAATALGLGGAGGAMTTGGAALAAGNTVANGAMVASAMPQQPAAATPAQTTPAETPAANKPAAPAQQTGQQTGQQPAAGEPAKPAAPQTPEQKQQANANLMQRINDPNVPDADKKQAAQQHVQQMLDSNPEMKQGMADLHAGKDTPQAKAFQAEVDKAGNAYIREEFARLRQQNPGATPQQQGGMLQGIMQSYQNMPEPMKWMMGIGLGGGLLGVLGSMFGGGGGMGLLGLLGLGAAGMAGAAGGMFGGGAQNFMADAISGIGKSMGMVPEKLTDQQKQILLAKDPVAHITNSGKVPTRADAAKQVAAGREQLGQIQMLNSMGGMTPRMLENMGLSAEEAQLAAKNVGTLSSQYADQNSALNQHLQKGEEYSKPTWTSWGQELGSYMLGKRGCDLAQQWIKNADEKATKEWMQKFRARGQKGRWVNTRRGSKMETRVTASNN